ncbi:MAG: hypothetical protein Q8M92_08255, partial [Candidatus Subteraquimicrobiales bacterium]|nr:hypothetical protein [Candidatus Subteraquimicrobiales bacterium]
GYPFSCYVIRNMTPGLSYEDVDYTYRAPVNYRQSFLTDQYSNLGITASYNGGGTGLDGIAYADIAIDIEDVDDTLPDNMVIDERISGGLYEPKIFLNAPFIRNCMSPKYRISDSPDMLNSLEFNVCNIGNTGLFGVFNEWAYRWRGTMPVPCGGIQRYIQLVAQNGEQESLSNIIPFTGVQWFGTPSGYSLNKRGLYYCAIHLKGTTSYLAPMVCGFHIIIKYSGATVIEEHTEIQQYANIQDKYEAEYALEPNKYYILQYAYYWGDSYGTYATRYIPAQTTIPGTILISSAVPTKSDLVAITHSFLDEADEYVFRIIQGNTTTTVVVSIGDYNGNTVSSEVPYPGQC